jgi:hypothetical protein
VLCPVYEPIYPEWRTDGTNFNAFSPGKSWAEGEVRGWCNGFLVPWKPYTGIHLAPVMIYMEEKFSLETLGTEQSLDLRAIGDKAWKAIVESCTASELKLYYLKIRSLAGIERLRRTVKLHVEYANKVEDISPLFAMHWLESLTVYDFPRIRRLDGIEALEGLKGLQLSGNRGSMNPPLELESVRPIASLKNLEKLEITNIRLEDRDISFIATAFPRLRSLRLSGKEFERTQLAYLAKRLNPQLDEPQVGSWEMDTACRKCGGKVHVFMGRRMGALCPACDEKKFKKLTEEWERTIQAS